jgi:hypothetical protein
VQRITKIGMEEPFSNKRGKEKDRVWDSKKKKSVKNPIWESRFVHGPVHDRCRCKDLLSVIRKLSAVSLTVTHTHFSTTTPILFNLLPSSTCLHSISFLQTAAEGKRNYSRTRNKRGDLKQAVFVTWNRLAFSCPWFAGSTCKLYTQKRCMMYVVGLFNDAFSTVTYSLHNT